MHAILFCFTIIALTFVNSNLIESLSNESICSEIQVKISSSIQSSRPQIFTLDIKKIKQINITVGGAEFASQNYVPLEEVGFVLEKTATSKVIDPIQHKYLRNGSTSVWFPYSYTGDWSRNGFIISNQMKRTSASRTETPLVTFEFLNDKNLNSVSDKDMNDILTWLKMNSETRKTIKAQIKGKIEVYQNAYFQTLTSIATMKKTNNNSAAEITSLTSRISVIITLIATLQKQEQQMDKEESAKSALLSTNNDEIDNLIAKINGFKVQIAKESASLNDLKPKDTTLLKQELKSALLLIKLPQFPPEKFLEEYSIGRGNNASIVKNSYENCVPDILKFNACVTLIFQASQLKKKLRRSFF